MLSIAFSLGMVTFYSMSDVITDLFDLLLDLRLSKGGFPQVNPKRDIIRIYCVLYACDSLAIFVVKNVAKIWENDCFLWQTFVVSKRFCVLFCRCICCVLDQEKLLIKFVIRQPTSISSSQPTIFSLFTVPNYFRKVDCQEHSWYVSFILSPFSADHRLHEVQTIICVHAWLKYSVPCIEDSRGDFFYCRMQLRRVGTMRSVSLTSENHAFCQSDASKSVSNSLPCQCFSLFLEWDIQRNVSMIPGALQCLTGN